AASAIRRLEAAYWPGERAGAATISRAWIGSGAGERGYGHGAKSRAGEGRGRIHWRTGGGNQDVRDDGFQQSSPIGRLREGHAGNLARLCADGGQPEDG